MTLRPDSPSRHASWAKQLVTFFIEPHEQLQHNPELRRQSRLLGTLLLLIVPFMIIGITWIRVNPEFMLYLWAGLGIVVAAYILNRKGYYQGAALIVLALTFSTPYVARSHPEDAAPIGGEQALLMLTMMPVVVAYLLFDLRIVVVTAAANASMLLVLYFLKLASPDVILVPLFIVLTISTLIIIAAVMRQFEQNHARKQSEALTESEERYRTLFNASFEGIIMHEDGILLDMNPAFERLIGGKRDELVGAPIFRFIHPDDLEMVRLNIEGQVSEPYSARGLRRDGTMVMVEVRGRNLHYRGRHVRVTAIRDISDRIENETHLFDLSLQRERVIMLQRFISQMSHDLRTPLTAMKTSAYLLRRLIDQPEKRDRQLEILEQQIEHLKRIIEDLLSISRLDRADRSDFTFEALDANVLGLENFQEVVGLAQRKALTFTFEPSEWQALVYVDGAQFKRMIKHLLLNAIHYTAESGTVTLKILLDDVEWRVSVVVEDSGIGIPPLELPHIFEHFYRGDSARSAAQGGTGLGLTIARKLAEAMAGEIQVESTVAKGTKFTVRLPRVHQDDLLPEKDDLAQGEGE